MLGCSAAKNAVNETIDELATNENLLAAIQGIFYDMDQPARQPRGNQNNRLSLQESDNSGTETPLVGATVSVYTLADEEKVTLDAAVTTDAQGKFNIKLSKELKDKLKGKELSVEATKEDGDNIIRVATFVSELADDKETSITANAKSTYELNIAEQIRFEKAGDLLKKANNKNSFDTKDLKFSSFIEDIKTSITSKADFKDYPTLRVPKSEDIKIYQMLDTKDRHKNILAKDEALKTKLNAHIDTLGVVIDKVIEVAEFDEGLQLPIVPEEFRGTDNIITLNPKFKLPKKTKASPDVALPTDQLISLPEGFEATMNFKIKDIYFDKLPKNFKAADPEGLPTNAILPEGFDAFETFEFKKDKNYDYNPNFVMKTTFKFEEDFQMPDAKGDNFYPKDFKMGPVKLPNIMPSGMQLDPNAWGKGTGKKPITKTDILRYPEGGFPTQNRDLYNNQDNVSFDEEIESRLPKGYFVDAETLNGLGYKVSKPELIGFNVNQDDWDKKTYVNENTYSIESTDFFHKNNIKLNDSDTKKVKVKTWKSKDIDIWGDYKPQENDAFEADFKVTPEQAEKLGIDKNNPKHKDLIKLVNNIGDQNQGRVIFNAKCKGCHADNRKGKTSEQITSAVKQGRGIMPANLINDTELKDVIAYITSLN